MRTYGTERRPEGWDILVSICWERRRKGEIYEGTRITQEDKPRRMIWKVIAYRFEIFVYGSLFILLDFEGGFVDEI